jgi:large subunit ribosomal protein L7Ae
MHNSKIFKKGRDQLKIKSNKQKDLIYEILKKVRKTGSIAKGILETTRAVEKGTAKLVIIAKNVKPKKLISHLPHICKYKNIPVIWITRKEKLGEIIGLEIPTTSCAIVDEGEAKDLLEKLKSRKLKQKESS